MARTKISEFSVTPGDNTDIDGINIAEGCAPSGINDAIRELMAQLKDFQSGAAGDSITVVGTLAAKGTSSAAADLKLYEDTDNGTNYVGFIAPASIASNVQWTLPGADGSSGQALQTNGSGTLSFATLGISAGGTGQTTANAAFNALAPSQTSNAGRYLKTDGTNTSWDLLDISTADITGTLPVANGGTGITSFGTGVATALGINVGSSGAFVTNGGALGTPSSGTVTNLTGTASININGTVGATTPNTGSFTTLTTSSTVTINGGTANGVAYLNGSKVLTTGSALTFDGSKFSVIPSGAGGGELVKVGFSAGSNYVRIGAYSGYGEVFSESGNMVFGASGANSVLTYTNGALRQSIGTDGTTIWNVAGSEQMRLTSTGLGIGTSSPFYKLDVAGDIRGNSWIGRTNVSAPTADAAIYRAADNTLAFSTANTERARITSGGNLLVGTTTESGSGRLRVVDSIRVANSSSETNALLITTSTTASTIETRYETPLVFGAGAIERARITSGGDFCVNTTAKVYEGLVSISFNGNGGAGDQGIALIDTNATLNGDYLLFANSSGNVAGKITHNGTTTVAYTTSSDYRLKDNQQPLAGSGAFIDALKPKTWNWKSDGSKGVGFIAHEVQEVSPGSVIGEKDGEQMQVMEYGSAEFIANIIAELQSLRARVAQLEAK